MASWALATETCAAVASRRRERDTSLISSSRATASPVGRESGSGSVVLGPLRSGRRRSTCTDPAINRSCPDARVQPSPSRVLQEHPSLAVQLVHHQHGRRARLAAANAHATQLAKSRAARRLDGQRLSSHEEVRTTAGEISRRRRLDPQFVQHGDKLRNCSFGELCRGSGHGDPFVNSRTLNRQDVLRRTEIHEHCPPPERAIAMPSVLTFLAPLVVCGAGEGNRTPGLSFTRALLCHLSYSGAYSSHGVAQRRSTSPPTYLADRTGGVGDAPGPLTPPVGALARVGFGTGGGNGTPAPTMPPVETSGILRRPSTPS